MTMTTTAMMMIGECRRTPQQPTAIIIIIVTTTAALSGTNRRPRSNRTTESSLREDSCGNIVSTISSHTDLSHKTSSNSREMETVPLIPWWMAPSIVMREIIILAEHYTICQLLFGWNSSTKGGIWKGIIGRNMCLDVHKALPVSWREGPVGIVLPLWSHWP